MCKLWRSVSYFVGCFSGPLFFGLVFSGVASANEADLAHSGFLKPSCYRNEINPITKQPFATSEIYADEIARWNRVNRSAVGPIDLFKAYRTYRRERPRAEALANDKAMHCYIGCMVAISTSPKVTDYVGWLKELEDLTDCNLATHFEDADADATSRGARLGARDSLECKQRCSGEFGPPTSSVR